MTILKSGKNDQFAIAISREPINDGLFGGIDFKLPKLNEKRL